MRTDLSPRQLEFYYNSDAFLNIADGAVRSGKTHVNLHRFAVHTQVAPPGDMMMVGRTRETVERNAISPMQQLLGPRRVRYNRGLGIARVGERLIWVVGINDAQAEAKIRGATLAGSYVNEGTVLQESAFDQLYDRHSVDGARMFLDTNPDSPFHWLKTKWIDNAALADEDLYRLRFSLRDNPYLPATYVSRLLRSHTGLWKRRMIDGEWVQAEGSIYEQWDEDVHVVDALPGKPEKVAVGVDVGTQNATVFLAAALVRGAWYVFAEYYHSGRETGRQRTSGEYADDFVGWLGKLGYAPSSVDVDPSAADFKLELRRRAVRNVRDADNSVIEGIRTVSTALTAGTLKVLKGCEGLRAEFPSYVWDPKAQKRGEDKPLKNQDAKDHALDACRYLVMRVLNRPALRVLGKPVGL